MWAAAASSACAAAAGRVAAAAAARKCGFCTVRSCCHEHVYSVFVVYLYVLRVTRAASRGGLHPCITTGVVSGLVGLLAYVGLFCAAAKQLLQVPSQIKAEAGHNQPWCGAVIGCWAALCCAASVGGSAHSAICLLMAAYAVPCIPTHALRLL